MELFIPGLSSKRILFMNTSLFDVARKRSYPNLYYLLLTAHSRWNASYHWIRFMRTRAILVCISLTKEVFEVYEVFSLKVLRGLRFNHSPGLIALPLNFATVVH